MKWYWASLKTIWYAYWIRRRIAKGATQRRQQARASRDALRLVQGSRLSNDYLGYVERMTTRRGE